MSQSSFLNMYRCPDRGDLSGTTAAIANKLGTTSILIRGCFAILSTAMGLGILLYLLAWAFIPKLNDPQIEFKKRPSSFIHGLGTVFISIGILLFCRYFGLYISDSITTIVACNALGAVLVWERSDTLERDEIHGFIQKFHSGAATTFPAIGWLRLVLAGIAVATSVIVLITTGIPFSFNTVTAIISSSLLTLLGVVTISYPMISQAAKKAKRAEQKRFLAQERADMAAHLHDSVLQTLALIQRTKDTERIHQISRKQERELRSWLFNDFLNKEQKGFREALEETVAEIEGQWPVNVELVVVGDTDLDDNTQMLLYATQEGILNAAKHAGVQRVDVFVDISKEKIEIWIRDQGTGFDMSSIEDSRQGIRGSIMGRMERLGGEVEITSIPNEGTEIGLVYTRS